ncbi:kinase-like domain-containing protein [Sporodiniella umbellata]|nr:kinase-like domain-containing protein [Sporodiniella umbellata]
MPNKKIATKLKAWWQQRTKKDAGDWKKNLSPNHPPLPTLSSESIQTTLQNDSSPIQNHSNIIIESISKNSKKKLFYSLFPILEESEIVITEESSNIRQNRSPETSSSNSIAPSPPHSWVLDEEKSKQHFVQMILTAKQSKEMRPSHLSLVFNETGNIDSIHMFVKGQLKNQKFTGNAQCIPPEIMDSKYNSEKAEVWILGIYLYNLLTGKYPFQASNDERLLKRMAHTTLSLPNELSQDAKDLLQRMLAPDVVTRASLDLVIYHPWLQAYREHLLSPIPSPEPASAKKKKTGRFKRTVSLVLNGPYPPPKNPYHDLSHLGTRDSVFARQRPVVQ